MADLPGFPDAEMCVMALLEDLAANPDDVRTTIPDDLQARVNASPTPRPVIRVRRIGGPNDRTTDRPRVDVEVYASTRAQAQPLAERCRQRLISKLVRTDHGIIDRVEVEVGPHEIPYEDENIRLFAATYRPSLRRRTSLF